MESDLAKIKKAGVEKIIFAWAGEFERGEPHYYRIQGPTFLMEYDNTQNNANHVHAVWRDFENDFGEDILRKHYEAGEASSDHNDKADQTTYRRSVTTRHDCCWLLFILPFHFAALLMQSETDIQTSLLKQTPIGLHKSEVRALVEKQGWLNMTGTDLVRLPGPTHAGPFSYIDGTLGRYSLPFTRTVVYAIGMTSTLIRKTN